MRLRSALVCFVCALLPTLSSAVDLELYSISPAATTTGATVQILGAGFSSATKVMLGGQELTPQLLSNAQLQLLVPQFEEGDYSLQLTDGVVTTTQSLSLRVELPPPSITSLSPANINECSNLTERQVTVSGRNFQPGSSLLLNGSAVPISVDSEQSISFAAPQLDAGIYGLQVVNPNGKRSLPYSLYFNNIPKIYSLGAGDNYVGSYQLIIEGKNFYPHSTLVVREYPSGFGDAPPQQRVIRGRDVAHGADGTPLRGQGDYLNYVDCNTLIYYRFPYSGQDKDLTLQIVNRDGKSSAIEQLSTP